MRAIRIGDYLDMPEVDYEQPALFTWKEFYNFRNHVLRVLRVFGSAGPMGEADLSATEGDQPCFSAEVVEDPAFFVVDDMYNEHDRISIVECDPAHIDGVVIESLCVMMLMFPGWWVSFSLGDSGILVSSDAVLVGGRRFWDCTSLSEISERCQLPVDFGPSEPLFDSMNDFWRIILVGGIDRTVQFPIAPSRQWAEILHSLEVMRSRRKNGHLTTFAYDQVRNDLHPQTRRELLLRFLKDLPTFPREMLAAVKRNIQQDSAKALVDSASPEDARELAHEIWSAVEATNGKFCPNEVVNWWADVLSKVKEPPDWLKNALEHEMRIRANHPNQLIQLSSLFGLARVRTTDISFFVNNAMATRPEWLGNVMLMSWLEKLKFGKAPYPDRSMLKSPNVLQ